MVKEQDNNCKLTVYIDKPAVVKNDFTRLAGHLFLGLTDDKGSEKRIGFYPKFFIVGQENVPSEDRINNPKDVFKKIAGTVEDETYTRYQYAIEYPITKKQYNDALQFIEKWKKENRKYVGAFNNCATFVIKTAKKAGIRTPPQLIAGIHSPHGTLLSIFLKEKVEQADFWGKRTKEKLNTFFVGCGNVVKVVSNGLKETTQQSGNTVRKKLLTPKTR